MHRAYKAHIISTIVDLSTLRAADVAYKAHIISTIVDEIIAPTTPLEAYKAHIISTIVDSIGVR